MSETFERGLLVLAVEGDGAMLSRKGTGVGIALDAEEMRWLQSCGLPAALAVRAEPDEEDPDSGGDQLAIPT